jgi:hypothetical protein
VAIDGCRRACGVAKGSAAFCQLDRDAVALRDEKLVSACIEKTARPCA